MSAPELDIDERSLRATTPVFINSFEQLTYLRDTVDWFARHGFRDITVLEQGSIYPPLLEYLASADFASKAKLHRFRRNIGPRRAVRRAVDMSGYASPMIFTDPDLELPEPPAEDFLTRLIVLGRKYDVVKVGLGLDIFDKTKVNTEMYYGERHTIGSYYKRFFRNEREEGVYAVGVDTTFFVYVPRTSPDPGDILSSQPRIPAIRVAAPGFLAGHRPWMYDNGMTPEEEQHYRSRTTISSTLFGR